MDWNGHARRVLRAEIARCGVSYAELAERLQNEGVAVTESAIAKRMSRGAFSFAFFLQCMHALSVTHIRLDAPVTSGHKRPS